MKRRRNSNLAIYLVILLGILLACPLCANADDKGSNEKLLVAIRDSDAQAASALLSIPSGGANANARDDDGMTALMYAASSENNDPELLKSLLARGAEINVKAKDGETALKLAGRKGKTEIVRLLEKAGAKE